MPNTRSVDFSVSPSRLARAFEFSCDRRLRLSLTRPNRLPEPWYSTWVESKRAEDESATTQGIFQSGYLWEERALSQLADPSILIAPPGDVALSKRQWGSAEESLKVLANAEVGQLLYQLELSPPNSLYQRFGFDPDEIMITHNFTDLIQVLCEADIEPTARDPRRAESWLGGEVSQRGAPYRPEERVFRVIDLKRSARVKTSHQVQTLFYALELDRVLKEAGIPGRVDLTWAGVWLGDTPSPEYFRIDALLPYFDTLIHRLPDLLSQPISEASWSLQAECEWCPFQAECSREARDEDRVTRLAGLTPRAVQFLEERDVSTLPQLRALLTRPDADELLARCATLEGKRRRLSARVEAYERGRPIHVEGVAAQLPRYEDIRIFLTAHHDGVARRPWALGLRVAQRSTHLNLGASNELNQLYLAHDESDSLTQSLAWSSQLCEYLCAIDTFNQGRDWREQLSLQLYCYSPLERRMITDLLIALQENPNAHPRLGEVVIHLQGPALLQSSQHPERLSETPIVTLLSELGSLMVLPIDKAYTLSEVSALLNLPTAYPRQGDLHFPYGHQLRSDIALKRWSAPPEERASLDQALARCAQDLEARLSLYDDLLQHLRSAHRGALVRWASRFRFPNPSYISDPALSKLAYLSTLDTRASREETRSQRFAPYAELMEQGKLVVLEAHAEDRFVIAQAPLGAQISRGYQSYLLVEASPEGLKSAATFVDDDVTRGWGKVKRKTQGVNHVEINEIKRVTDDSLIGAHLTLSEGGRCELSIHLGRHYLLLPRYKSHQLGQLEICLQEFDTGQVPNRLFLELLNDPRTAQRSLTSSPNERAHLETLRDQARLTPSQSATWDLVFSQRVTPIWGPPGTGKTHLLASLITGALCAAAQERRSCVIYVSAMTHTAIEHLMSKCAQRLKSMADHLSLLFSKLDRWETRARPESIRIVKKGDLERELKSTRLALIGGTQWALNKLKSCPFDLMVIDEASQVLVSHSALGLSRLKPSGRLVVAGDHMQLGPILSEDAQIDGAEAHLSGSILDLIRERPSRPGIPLAQLLENWRMNRSLTEHAQLIYGPKYRCASEVVEARQLPSTLTASLTLPDPTALERLYRGLPTTYHTPELRALFEDPRALLTACLAPHHPLTVLSLHGLEVGRSNPVEAALVALLAYTLRLNPERDETRDLRRGSPRDDQSFWRDEVFMISPHHSQLETLRGLLETLSFSQVPPFAQTVDKAQGQEADTLLITYGVSDLDYAQHESGFIYDINRLNVAITRARAKAIVCLPEPLLRGSAQLINDPRSLDGLSYMQYLAKRASRGSESVFELGGGRSVVVASV